jgi:VanZ family protein
MGARTLARPLTGVFVLLVCYASLYPFSGWRFVDVNPFGFLFFPLPRYWTAFDVVANFLGYIPLGLLLALTVWGSERVRGLHVWAFLGPSLLSLIMETLQVYLPSRVASNADWLLNSAGGAVGAGLGMAWARLGQRRNLSRWRGDWFVSDAHGALVLLALWPLTLLYPASVPFGLGHVWGRVEGWVLDGLAMTPFVHWVPESVAPGAPLGPAAVVGCVALSLLAPVLLAYSSMRRVLHRAVWWGLTGVVCVSAATLSDALTYGPGHAWAWLTPPVVVGMGLAGLSGLLSLGLSRRACLVWLLLVLSMAVTMLNRAPDSPYLAESLDVWAQGRFIRFHGIIQWLGWVWPYAVLWHGARQILIKAPQPKITS